MKRLNSSYFNQIKEKMEKEKKNLIIKFEINLKLYDSKTIIKINYIFFKLITSIHNNIIDFKNHFYNLGC
jgi:hypothetical protein